MICRPPVFDVLLFLFNITQSLKRSLKRNVTGGFLPPPRQKNYTSREKKRSVMKWLRIIVTQQRKLEDVNPRTDFWLDADGETGHQQRFQLDLSTGVDNWQKTMEGTAGLSASDAQRIIFHRRTRNAYVYNGCLAWYNVVLTPRIHSTVKYSQLGQSANIFGVSKQPQHAHYTRRKIAMTTNRECNGILT